MTLDTLKAHIAAELKALGPEISVEYGEIQVEVLPKNLLKTLSFLRDCPDCQFAQLTDIAGADYPQRPQRFEVVYHLLSLKTNRRIRVKIPTDEDTAVPSVLSLFPNAGWYEREAYDMYGILFEGNPDLRRILTDYGFEGYPLRKDFPLTGYTEVRYDEDQKKVVYEPVKLTQDFRTFDSLSPWEGMDEILPGDEKASIQGADFKRKGL